MKRVLFSLLLFFTQDAMAQFPSHKDTIGQTTVEPYSKICYMRICRKQTFKKDKWFKSTGFFIRPDVILTAAHNIHSPKMSRVSHIKIFPGRYYESYPFDSIEIKGEANCFNAIRTPEPYSFGKRKKKRKPYDFGIIVVPENVLASNAKIDSTVVFTLSLTEKLHAGDTIQVAGYPAEKKANYNGELMIYQKDTCRQVYRKTFSHLLETYRGNSGSPIWKTSNGIRYVAGIHTFKKSATRLDEENLRLLLNWLKEIDE